MTLRVLFGVALLAALAAAGCGPAAGAAAVGHEYDLQYAMARGAVLTTPSPFLVAEVERAAPAGRGRGAARPAALDIGSGSGRNSLYLARRGYQVTAVDLSKVGLALTRQQARDGNLPVETVERDINQFDIGWGRWDLVLLIDFPFPYQGLLPKIAAGLKPGGVVIVQEVAARQPREDSPDHRLRYTFMRRGDLDLPFAGLRVLHDEVAQEPTVWGVTAWMVRYAARKGND